MGEKIQSKIGEYLGGVVGEGHGYDQNALYIFKLLTNERKLLNRFLCAYELLAPCYIVKYVCIKI